MRKLTYLVASTLDGFIAGPDGSFDFFPVSDSYLEFLSSEYPETIPTPGREALGIDPENKHFDTVLEGRGSYGVGLKAGITDAYAHLRHYVFSQSMTTSPDPAVELVSTDPVAKVHELKQEEGKGIWVCGGATLAETLRAEIDVVIVKIYPVAIGSGMPLFAGEFQPRPFTLTDSHVHDSGVAIMTYTAL